MIPTADLFDAHSNRLQVATSLFQDYGARRQFKGLITTLSVFEDNSLVRSALEQPSEGGVLVVDGNGSRRCALIGDRLGTLAVRNGWSGIVIHGCVRDTAELARLDIGIKALGACPAKSQKRGKGKIGVAVWFADVCFHSGHYLYADQDGIVLAKENLV